MSTLAGGATPAGHMTGMNSPRTSPANTSLRLVYTPSPTDPCRIFDAGTEVIYTDFFETPVIDGTAWVCKIGSRGVVAVAVADLSVVAS